MFSSVLEAVYASTIAQIREVEAEHGENSEKGEGEGHPKYRLYSESRPISNSYAGKETSTKDKGQPSSCPRPGTGNSHHLQKSADRRKL
jgi:hypothetical protein